MSDATEEFFHELGRRGYEPLVAKFSGSIRFDVTDGDHTARWLVRIDRGNVAVSSAGGDGDCTIRADRALFDRLARGEEQVMAAALRGALVCSGDVEMLLAIQRVFPGPPRTAVRTGAIGSR
jgi:predicted lipid carrier protein YhbT